MEDRLALAPDSPVHVAQVIVDGSVAAAELYRGFHRRHRVVVAAEFVVSPPEAVDDIAVVRLELDRGLNHFQSLIEIFATVDPRIAEIVEDRRLVRIKRQGALQVRFRFRPVLALLE